MTNRLGKNNWLLIGLLCFIVIVAALLLILWGSDTTDRPARPDITSNPDTFPPKPPTPPAQNPKPKLNPPSGDNKPVQNAGPERVATLGGYTGGDVVKNLFTPDGKLFLRSNYKGRTEIWDTQTWKLTGELKYEDADKSSTNGTSPAISADGKTIAIARYMCGPKVEVWDISSSTRIRSFSWEGVDSGLGLSADGKVLFAHTTRDYKTPLSAITLANDQKREIAACLHGLNYFVISPDGLMLAVRGEDSLDLIHSNDGSLICQIKIPSLQGISFSANGKTLIGNDEKAVFWFNTSDGRQLGSYLIGNARWGPAVLSPDGKLIAISSNPHLILIDAATGKQCGQLPGKWNVLALFSPDGKWLTVTEAANVEVYKVSSLIGLK